MNMTKFALCPTSHKFEMPTMWLRRPGDSSILQMVPEKQERNVALFWVKRVTV